VPSHRPPPKPVILHQRTVSPCFNLSDALALALALLVPPPPCHVMSRRVGSSGNQEQASQPHSSLDTCSCGSALRPFPFLRFLFLFHSKVSLVCLVRGRMLVLPASGHECAGWLTSCAVARCHVCWCAVDCVLAFGMVPVLVLLCWVVVELRSCALIHFHYTSIRLALDMLHSTLSCTNHSRHTTPHNQEKHNVLTRDDTRNSI
jgi:hypothetical protein